MMMIRFSLFLILVSLASMSVLTAQADLLSVPAISSVHMIKASTTIPEKDARAFIDSVAARGIGFLSTDKANVIEQKRLFRELLHDSFDLPTIGRFALGKYWRAATSAQRSEYQTLFEQMVIETYAARFASYKGQKLDVTSAKTVEGGDVMVGSQIVPADGAEKINVDWRVRANGSSLKIVDIVIEGVSMAVTQRSDFSGLIGQKNGDIMTLIDYLKTRKRDSAAR